MSSLDLSVLKNIFDLHRPYFFFPQILQNET